MSFSDIKGILTLCLVVLGPTIVPRILSSFRPRPPAPPTPPASHLAKSIIGIHTLYRIYQLVRPPFNLFTTYGLSIYTSNDLLRQKLFPRSTSSLTPALVGRNPDTDELLLTKLASLDNRLLYARFGHRPLLNCAWCHTKTDYAISAMAGIAEPYLVVAVFIGILGFLGVSGPTASSRKTAWRSAAGWTLAVMAISDVGFRYFWDIRVTEGDTLQLDALIQTFRSIALLLLPVMYILLPLPTTFTLSTLIPGISNATSTIRLTALARNASLQNPALRETLLRSIQEEQELRGVARRDSFVQASAERLGMREGDMRGSARRWIEEGWNGLVRIGQTG